MTVQEPPATTTGADTGFQVAVPPNAWLDSRTKAAELVLQERTIWPPLRATWSAGSGTKLATRLAFPATMNVKQLVVKRVCRRVFLAISLCLLLVERLEFFFNHRVAFFKQASLFGQAADLLDSDNRV